MFIGAVFGLFASFKFGRYLLESFPGFFSLGYVTKAGPPKAMAESSYFKMTLKVINVILIIDYICTIHLISSSVVVTMSQYFIGFGLERLRR